MPVVSESDRFIRRVLVLALLTAVVFVFGGCASSEGTDEGKACASDGDCSTGVCLDSVCAASDEDQDGDGVYNRAEARLGTDPAVADSDGDGLSDRDEIFDTTEPTDSDGDGLIDAVESAIIDSDGDCLPDQADADNDNISGPAASYLEDVCRRGVCAGESAAGHVTVVCVNGFLACSVEGLDDYVEEEVGVLGCADDLDNDCDGETDEGSPDTDDDGLDDCEDPDDDDDGVADEDDCLPTDDRCLRDCSDSDGNDIPDCAQTCVAPYGEFCDDGVACTVDDCDEDEGCIHTPQHEDCDDGDPCTDDVCETAGCVHLPLSGGSCDDGNPCTVDDFCLDGGCQAGPDECDCRRDVDCEILEDGDACNGTLVCAMSEAPYKCVVNPTTVVLCNDANDTACAANICHTDVSSGEGRCSMEPIHEGEVCDDGSRCSGTVAEPDQCQAGVCVPGGLVCECLTDVDCITTETNLCEVSPYCDMEDGVCVQRALSVDCSGVADSNPDDCYAPKCVPTTGLCEMQPRADGSSCVDGFSCRSPDSCDDSGVCQPGPSLICDDHIECTVDFCSEAAGGCVNEPDDAACDDEEICTTDTCSLQNDGCVNEPVAGLLFCDDGDDCTENDYCAVGQCTGDEICECRQDADCAALENGNLCDGTLICDFSEENFPNSCVVDPDTISDACSTTEDTQCRHNLCLPETGVCAMQDVREDDPCDDGDACTSNAVCQNGVCYGWGNVDCPDDDNPCTTALCDDAEGCIQQPGACSCLAAVFAGAAEERVVVEDHDDLEAQGVIGFTVEFWVRPTIAGPMVGGRPLVTKMDDESTGDWALLLREDDAVFRLYRDGDVPLEIEAFSALPIDTWTHLSAVVSPSDMTLRLFVGGQPVALQALSGTVSRTAAALVVGPTSDLPDSYTAAAIDEVRVWQRARTESAIASDFERVLFGDEQGLVAYWNFDDMTGASPTGTVDLTGNGHDASFTVGSTAPATQTVDFLEGCEGDTP